MQQDRDFRPVIMENVQLIYRNFRGIEGDYNPKGHRSFCVILDEETASRMDADGWNIRWPKPSTNKDEDPLPPYINVTVSYALRAPIIKMIYKDIVDEYGNNKQILLDESTLDQLDWVDIVYTDLSITPSYWTMGGESGIKAYLSSLYVTIKLDALATKYDVNLKNIDPSTYPFIDTDDN